MTTRQLLYDHPLHGTEIAELTDFRKLGDILVEA